MNETTTLTIPQALAHAQAEGVRIAGRTLRLACIKGWIPGAEKVGRDWLIPPASLESYLANRPRRGPKRRPQA